MSTYDEYYQNGRQTPSSDDSQLATQADDVVLLVDRLANNYNLSAALRDDLHSFLEVAHSLPTLELKIAIIQQATTLQNQQMLINTQKALATMQESVATIYNSLSTNAHITKHHTSEIQAVCKLIFYNGRRIDFDNDALKRDVMPLLKKNKKTNGLLIFFQDDSKTNLKLLTSEVGQQLSYVKTYMRRAMDKSLPSHDSPGISATSLATELAKKCLQGSENVKPQHVIWCMILRSFLRNHPDVRMAASADDEEFPVQLLPSKRTHNGTPKKADSKVHACFWNRIAALWAEKNKAYGSDLQSPAWNQHIRMLVKKELELFPSDPLTLVVGTGGDAAGSSSISEQPRHEVPLTTSNARNVVQSVGGHSGQASLDRLINTPTNFTWGGNPIRGPTLPALNLSRMDRADDRAAGFSSSPGFGRG
ncbi:hypothetical protein K438DRAFT_1946778 [Mycena galopus ATCC 62051]|nr:hypothetical protein K438DRAFT_1946778 [Mycena galopus ATCC 62051]